MDSSPVWQRSSARGGRRHARAEARTAEPRTGALRRRGSAALPIRAQLRDQSAYDDTARSRCRARTRAVSDRAHACGEVSTRVTMLLIVAWLVRSRRGRRVLPVVAWTTAPPGHDTGKAIRAPSGDHRGCARPVRPRCGDQQLVIVINPVMSADGCRWIQTQLTQTGSKVPSLNHETAWSSMPGPAARRDHPFADHARRGSWLACSPRPFATARPDHGGTISGSARSRASVRKRSMTCRNSAAISGSNWVPAQRSISLTATRWGRARRYARSLVIAS